MHTLLALLVLAVVFNGTLAGASLDTSLVKLPARRRIGARAYAVFAATIAGLVHHAGTGATVPLVGASAASLVHFGATSRAAPRSCWVSPKRRAGTDGHELAEPARGPRTAG